MNENMQAVVVQGEIAPVPEQRSDSAALIQVIERAAMNPNVDIDKMERLLLMQERIMERNAKAAYSAALSRLQPDLPTIKRDGKIVITDKANRQNIIQSTPYALWEDINEAIKPKLAEHGFSLSFRCGTAPDGKVTVTGVLAHCDGHQEETTMTLQHDSTGSKNAVQAVGSTISYGKRYTAGMLLNITSRAVPDADDDGNAAGGRKEPELDESVQRYLEMALDKIAGIETADALTAWWAEQKEQRISLDIINTKAGPKPGYRELFAAFSKRGKELSA